MVKLGQSYTCRHAFTSTAQVAMRSGVMAAGGESELREGMQGKEAVAATIKRQKHAGVHMHASIVMKRVRESGDERVIDSCKDQQFVLLMPKHESSQVQEMRSYSDSKSGVEGLGVRVERSRAKAGKRCGNLHHDLPDTTLSRDPPSDSSLSVPPEIPTPD